MTKWTIIHAWNERESNKNSNGKFAERCNSRCGVMRDPNAKDAHTQFRKMKKQKHQRLKNIDDQQHGKNNIPFLWVLKSKYFNYDNVIVIHDKSQCKKLCAAIIIRYLLIKNGNTRVRFEQNKLNATIQCISMRMHCTMIKCVVLRHLIVDFVYASEFHVCRWSILFAQHQNSILFTHWECGSRFVGDINRFYWPLGNPR